MLTFAVTNKTNNIMESTIKERIINNQECFEITFGVSNTINRLLGGTDETKEALFFVQRDENNNLVFCRMKLPNEIEPDDFFVFSEKHFDEYIKEGRVEMF